MGNLSVPGGGTSGVGWEKWWEEDDLRDPDMLFDRNREKLELEGRQKLVDSVRPRA